MSAVQAAPRPLWYSALPLAVAWVGLPLWWALGVQRGLLVLVAVPLGIWMLVRLRNLELPLPFLLYLGFLCWVLLSATALTSMRYGASYTMRLAFYSAAFVVGLYVWNALRRGLSPRLLIWCVVPMWAAAILLALPGLGNAGLGFTSPAEWLMSRVGIDNEFLLASAHPELSEWDAVYGVARPSPLHAYTNEWGAAIGVMTPVAVYAMLTTHLRAARWGIGIVLALAIVPVLVSLNRGCWISLAVAVLYVLTRRALAGKVKPLAITVGIGTVATFGVLLSPLGELLSDRFAYSNTSTRSTLYEASWTFASRSPLIGYGAPQSSAGIADSNGVAVGTHGQLWTLLVSQGFVGAALFVAMLVAMVWFARPVDGSAPEVWLHAVGLVVLVQIAFYEVVPDGLSIAFVALAVTATTAGRYVPHRPPAVTRRRDDNAVPA